MSFWRISGSVHFLKRAEDLPSCRKGDISIQHCLAEECSQDIMGAMPPPASPLEEEEVSPSGRWLATQQLFDFEKIEALVVCEVGMADCFVDVYVLRDDGNLCDKQNSLWRISQRVFLMEEISIA